MSAAARALLLVAAAAVTTAGLAPRGAHAQPRGRAVATRTNGALSATRPDARVPPLIPPPAREPPPPPPPPPAPPPPAPLPLLPLGGVLALRDALAAARANVPSILAAIGQARAARAQIGLARAPLLPLVTGAVGGSAFGQNTVSFGGATIPCAPGIPCFQQRGGQFGYVYGDGTVGVRWTIWDFGRTASNVTAAEQGARAAREDVRDAERTALAAAATAYYALLADQELVAQAGITLAQRARELEIAEARVQTGLDPEINRTRAAIAEQTARLDLATAQATAANDAAALAGALGLDPSHPPRVVRPPDVSVEDDPERVMARAVALRPAVRAAQQRLASAESQLAAARAAWRPSVVTTTTLDLRYTQYNTGSGVSLQSAGATVGLSWPIYDPTIPANVRIAEAQVVTARAALAQQLLTVRTDAVQAAIAVRAARQQLDQALRNAELAAANLALSEGRYAVGSAPLLELVDAQAQDSSARLAVVQRRFQFEAAKVRLLAALDGLDVLAGGGGR